jgi:hypothetical protein
VPREERPIVQVTGFDTDPDRPAAGQTFRLRLDVRNVGERFAENIQLTLGGETFLPAEASSEIYLNDLDEGDGDSVEVRLQVATGTRSGVHALPISLRWDDSYGGSYSDQTAIGIEVAGDGAGRPLVVVSGSFLPGQVAPGVPFSLSLDLLNSGGREARNVVVSPTAGPLALSGAGRSGILHLPPGGSGRVTLRVIAAEPAQPGATSQTLEIRYDDPDGERFTDTAVIGVVVVDEQTFGPLPMVVDVDARGPDGPRLRPGEVFDLTLEVRNVGVGTARRTRLALGGGAAPVVAPGATGSGTTAGAGGASLGVFAPLGSSNVRYLGDLAADEVRVVEQQMVVDGAAKAGVYTLDVGFSYLDAEGQAYETGEVVTLLVTRPVALQINPLTVVTTTMVGQPVPLVVEITNAGGETVRVGNAAVEAGAGVQVENGTRFIGALDAGGIDTLDATLLPQRPGEAEVRVVVTYRDDFNQEQEIEYTFDLLVEDEPEVEMPEVDAAPVAERGLLARVVRGLLGLGASPARNYGPAPGRPFTGPDGAAPAGAPVRAVPAGP